MMTDDLERPLNIIPAVQSWKLFGAPANSCGFNPLDSPFQTTNVAAIINSTLTVSVSNSK